MKSIFTFLSFFIFAVSGFSQNNLYLYGFMQNAPQEPVTILATFNSTPPITVTLQTEPSGNIQTQGFFISGEWNTIETSFINCNGSVTNQSWADSSFENLVDIPFYFDFCSDTTAYIYGCTDPSAINYNPQATTDDGSCQYTADCDFNLLGVSILTDNWGYEVSWNILKDSAIVASGYCFADDSLAQSYWCLEDGCYIFQMFDSFGDGWNGGTYELTLDDGTLIAGTLADGSFGQVAFGIHQDGCELPPLQGCTDPEALNYNPNATIDDGSCQYPEPPAPNDLCANALPLSEGTLLIDNTNATQNEGIWGECWGFGQGEGEQSSLWYTFTTPDLPASIHIESSYDGSNTLTDTQFGIFQECGGDMIYCDGNAGEGLMSAFDFSCGELAENTTYILMIDGWNGDNGTCFLTYSVDMTCADPNVGCTDPLAINYNPNASIDDGSCEYAACTNVHLEIEALPNSVNSYTISNSFSAVLEGTYDNAGSGVDVCLPDGCYFLMLYTDSIGSTEFSVSTEDATLADGTFTANAYSAQFSVGTGCDTTQVMYGCTDPEALNYEPVATVDDGSCVYDYACTPVLIQFDGSSLASGSYVFASQDTVIQEGDYSGSDYGIQACLFDGCYILYYNNSSEDSLSQVFYTIFADNQIIESGTFGSSNPSGYTQFSIGGGCDSTEVIYGCTDPEALNYNPNANVDDGSCQFEEVPCESNEVTLTIHTVDWASEMSWNLVKDEIEIEGDGNYQDDNTYIYNWCLDDGCYLFEMFDSYGDGWNGGTYLISYNDSVLASGTLGYGLEYGAVNFGVNQQSCPPEPVYGCIDPEALNYDPNATVDNGSCIYESDCTPVFVQFGDSSMVSGSYILSSQDTVIQAGEYLGAGFGFNVCLYDGCYSLTFNNSAEDSLAEVYYAIFVSNQVIQSGSLGGSNQTNTAQFSIGAGCDSTQVIYGCTNPEAINYNPEATVDDGSCIVISNCDISFEVLPDSIQNVVWILPSGNITDAVSVLWDFGDGITSTDLFPQHNYEDEGPYTLCLTVSFEYDNGDSCSVTYCTEVSGSLFDGPGFNSNGFTINVTNNADPTGIVETNPGLLSLEIWPNPTKDQLSVQFANPSRLTSSLHIFDITGKLMIQKSISNTSNQGSMTIDVHNLPSGVYILKVANSRATQTAHFVKTN